jgi:hypothetical protein
LSEISVDTRILGFSVFLTVVTGVLVAVVPAMRASGWRLHDPLRSRGRATSQGRASRSILVVAEIAFARILLVGTGLMARTLSNQMNVPLDSTHPVCWCWISTFPADGTTGHASGVSLSRGLRANLAP